MYKKLLLFFTAVVASLNLYAQNTSNFSVFYDSPKTYELAGINIEGIKYLDVETLKQLSGLQIGDEIEIPGDAVTSAVKKYWKQGLFSDIKIEVDHIEGHKVYLNILLQERPRLAEVEYHGISKREKEDVEAKVLLLNGGQVTDNLINTAERTILQFFQAKGFFNTEVNIVQRDDPSKVNYVILDVNVDKHEKIRVRNIDFEGNENMSDNKLEMVMKKTKSKKLINLFSSKKFLEDLYNEDKKNIIAKYNKEGYRDAVIVSDTILHNKKKKSVDLAITVDEGKKYYFGDIKWIGNTVYPSETLNRVLNIQKGDVFDRELLSKRVNEADDAVSNLYLNNGYLFFNISPVEVNINKDSIDYEMRMFEGKQATINNITITGNTKTHEQVARRELRTLPGELFSKDAIIRSVRELANLQHFDPESINPIPIPNQEDGTVDIKYELKERANDQIELSGGWGAGMFVGTLGLRFTNFSMRNVLNKEAWRPLPTGDGQTLSIKAQSNGSYYQSYNFSFVEPWFGGKKPNSFSISAYYSKQTNGNSDFEYNGYQGYQGIDGGSSMSGGTAPGASEKMNVFGFSMGLGRRLKWPDDYFTLYTEVSYTQYHLENWKSFLFRNGDSHNLTFKTVFGRNSIDNPLYTRRGSKFELSLEFTPPYSWFDGVDYNDPDLDDDDRYWWIEYHKWKFSGDIYTPLNKSQKLILRTKFEFGFLGYYDEDRRSPFEQFNLGGDGMSGYNYYGSEIIGLRGYENNSLTAPGGGNLYAKYMMELRYPVSLNPSATIYALTFAEAGNSWYDFNEFNPFNVKRSAGVGIRIFLPMFGLMGFDWGYGFDEAYRPGSNGSQFHFIMGQTF